MPAQYNADGSNIFSGSARANCNFNITTPDKSFLMLKWMMQDSTDVGTGMPKYDGVSMTIYRNATLVSGSRQVWAYIEVATGVTSGLVECESAASVHQGSACVIADATGSGQVEFVEGVDDDAPPNQVQARMDMSATVEFTFHAGMTKDSANAHTPSGTGVETEDYDAGGSNRAWSGYDATDDATVGADWVQSVDYGFSAIGCKEAAGDITMTADSGAFNITGTAAVLSKTVQALSGSFLIAGTDAGFDRGLAVDPGAFLITGVAAALGLRMPADSGSFLITGTTAALGEVLAAGAGAFLISGTAANLGLRMDAASGTFLITGTDATTSVSSANILSADSGSFLITGQAAALGVGLNADPGSVIIVGTPAVLSETLSAQPGAFAITGVAAILSQTLSAESGSFIVTGTAATLLQTLSAGSGSFLITGTDANLIAPGAEVVMDIEVLLESPLTLEVSLRPLHSLAIGLKPTPGVSVN